MRCALKNTRGLRTKALEGHPIFSTGTKRLSFQVQAATLLCLLARIPAVTVASIMGISRTAATGTRGKMEQAQCTYAGKAGANIKYGNGRGRGDVEADETAFRKALAPETKGQDKEASEKKTRWEQWLGAQERGRPDSLKMERLSPGTTKPNAAGPGPIH